MLFLNDIEFLGDTTLSSSLTNYFNSVLNGKYKIGLYFEIRKNKLENLLKIILIIAKYFIRFNTC